MAHLQGEVSARWRRRVARSSSKADCRQDDADNEKHEGQRQETALRRVEGRPAARHRLQRGQAEPTVAVDGRHRRRVGVDDDRCCRLTVDASSIVDGHAL